jgi:UDP-glucose 4-epimerase
MIILTGHADGGRPAAVAIFGVGLIGSSVAEAVCRSLNGARRVSLPVDWSALGSLRSDLSRVERALRDVLKSGRDLAVLWSAGRAGFASAKDDSEAELTSFREVLGLVERCAAHAPDSLVSFHLVSSAGALFEGQRHVHAGSTPTPRRPYGELKLAQEQLLGTSALKRRRIYRVSSVYGYVRPDVRAGLITTLVRDALRRRVTRITGRMYTLRDFVFAPDLSAYIAAQMRDPAERGAEVRILASARPTSLAEVHHRIEEVFRRKVHVSYSIEPDNAEDITFAPTVLPEGWLPSDVRSNIGLIYRDALCDGALSFTARALATG